MVRVCNVGGGGWILCRFCCLSRIWLGVRITLNEGWSCDFGAEGLGLCLDFRVQAQLGFAITRV